jgi:hypothetical protein
MSRNFGLARPLMPEIPAANDNTPLPVLVWLIIGFVGGTLIGVLAATVGG